MGVPLSFCFSSDWSLIALSSVGISLCARGANKTLYTYYRYMRAYSKGISRALVTIVCASESRRSMTLSVPLYKIRSEILIRA